MRIFLVSIGEGGSCFRNVDATCLRLATTSHFIVSWIGSSVILFIALSAARLQLHTMSDVPPTNVGDPTVPIQKGRGVQGQYVHWITISHPWHETAARLGLKVSHRLYQRRKSNFSSVSVGKRFVWEWCTLTHIMTVSCGSGTLFKQSPEPGLCTLTRTITQLCLRNNDF